MKSSKKSFFTICTGIISLVITTSIGILLPRMFITTYGSEMNGFLSSLGQLFVYLTLLEAGVGTATLNALYRPLGLNNHAETNTILSTCNYFYKRTAILYFFSIIILSIVYPYLINSDIPVLTQQLLILLMGMSSLISYLYQSKYKLLLQAEGRMYVTITITTITQLTINITKIFLLLIGVNVVLLYVTAVILSVFEAVYYSFYIKKTYPWIDIKLSKDKNVLSNSKSTLIHQISWLVFNNTDILVLTFILGDLKLVSVYTLYLMLFSLVSTLINHVSNGFWYKLGQYYGSNDKRFMVLYNTFETYYIAFSISLYCITIIFIRPFLLLYTKGITDVQYVDEWLPILFTMFKILVIARAPASNVISFAQKFKETQYRAIIEMLINLTVSVIFSIYLGIYGVLIGTIVALLYRSNDIIIYSNKILMKRKSWETYKKLFLNLAFFIIIYMGFNEFNFTYSSYKSLFINTAIIGSGIVLFFILVNSILFKDEYTFVKNRIRQINKRATGFEKEKNQSF